MSLELARSGFHVTGLDVSGEALDLGRKLARDNPYAESWGGVDYVREDFLAWTGGGTKFDAITFFGALHHFPDPASVLDHALTLLRPGGVLIAREPARDWWTESDATLMAWLRTILSATGAWYQDIELPSDEAGVVRLAAATSAQIPLSAPNMLGNELAYVTESVTTTWVSTAGSFTTRFERDIAQFVGARHAVATNSGTAALHVALLLAGIEAEDEVLVSDMTFI